VLLLVDSSLPPQQVCGTYSQGEIKAEITLSEQSSSATILPSLTGIKQWGAAQEV